jgi:putative glutamine amidotransferase
MAKPRIGLSMDSSCKNHYSSYPWYALRKNYCESIVASGGIPLPLPHAVELIDDYLDLIDGLILTGGDFDHDPKLYGDTTVHPKTCLNSSRTTFEYELLKHALARKMPVLGICAGQQLLNIMYGGTLLQSISDAIPHALNHWQEECRHKPTHPIKITPGSLLAKAAKGQDEVYINSSHRQAVNRVGEGLIMTAVASDGVIEAIEDPHHPFCLGVQWHPEFFVDALDRTLYQLFIAAATAYKNS